MAASSRGAGEFEARFRRHAQTLAPFASAKRVIVAVSGGLDSMTLLRLLLDARAASSSAGLHVAHFDHAMRPGSGDDARWVATICRSWGVPARLGRAPAPARTEAEARELRYRFLEETRRSLGEPDAVVATGHTADDQAETVLFRIARGSGPGGLAGVLPQRSPAVARPLLPFWREELRAFAQRRGVPFRDDPSNLDARWARNHLRRTVLPALEAAVPGAKAALAAHAEVARLQALALDELLDERIARLAPPQNAPHEPPPRPRPPVLELDRAALVRLADPLLALVLRRAAALAGSDLGRGATAALVRFARRAQSGRRIDLPGGVAAEHDLGRLRFLGASARVPPPTAQRAPAQDRPPGRPARLPAARPAVAVASPAGEAAYAHEGMRVEVAWSWRPIPEFSNVMAIFDPSGPQAPLVVRPWEPGDRVAMPYGKKKVKKLLLEARIPRRRRAGAPVVAAREGPVLWVPGAMAAPRACSPSRSPVYLHVRSSPEPPP